MDLRQLKQFVAVAETSSFSRAAERLFMAQPPLSVAIRKLEEELGTPLFERTARGVRLTAPGAAALQAARKCLQNAEEVSTAARASATGEAGRLRIGFIGSVTFGLLPRLIQAFTKGHPQVKLELREGTNLELLSLVESGELDVGFVRVPTTRPENVRFQLIQTDVFCAALPRGHALAKQKQIALHDLADCPLIGYTPSRVGGLQAAVSHLFARAGISPYIAQEAVQVQTVVGLVDSGLGVALVPSVNASHSSGRVVFRPISDLPPDATIGISLAYHALSETAVTQRFRESIEVAETNAPVVGREAGQRSGVKRQG